MEGVQITLVSKDRISSLSTSDKMHFILQQVQDGKIIILEEGLEPEEEVKLIQKTMGEISPEKFNGIEIETYPEEKKNPSLLDRILGRNKIKGRMTVIGPADQLRTLEKKKDTIEALITLKGE